MERTPPNSLLTSHDEVKTVLNGDEEPDSSSTAEETKPETSSENKGNETAGAADSRSSPDPCCAICLEPLQNKSFTNSCLHMFCFKCLVEWSKIKPECPLCKQQFKSIIHNVQEDFQYDTYYIKNRATESYWNFTQSHSIASSLALNATASEPRFRYSTSMTADRFAERERTSLQTQIENHRMRFAPHSVSVVRTTQTTNRIPSAFRRQVYNSHLWVVPPHANRIRIATPEFFRLNPACTHRLLPWLNRELVALLGNNESQIVFVLELIMALITRYEIISREFLMHVEPYLLRWTSHFIHEFYNFASSPFEMDAYDRQLAYAQNSADHPVGPSSLNRDVITLDNEAASSNDPSGAESSRRAKRTHKHKDDSKHNLVEKVVLKRNRETDSWVTVMGPLPLMHDYSNLSNLYSNPGPSTSTGIRSGSTSLFNVPSPVSMISPVRIASDEECEVVAVVKPKAERTPEIVDLSSDEELPPAVIDVSSAEDVNSDIDIFPFLTPSNSPIISFLERCKSSSSVECIFESMTSSVIVPNPALQANVDMDRPVEEMPDLPNLADHCLDLASTSSQDLFNYLADRNSSPIDLSERNATPIDLSGKKPHVSSNHEAGSSWTCDKPSVPSKIVVPNSSMAQASGSYWGVSSTLGLTNSPSRVEFNDSSTDSGTDVSSPQKHAKKKVKLRSVVAHFSFDNSERQGPGHRSSHKKHKDKKKKKKHSRKHKHRIYSDSDSSS